MLTPKMATPKKKIWDKMHDVFQTQQSWNITCQTAP